MDNLPIGQFNRAGDYAQGYEDARNGFFRASTRPLYRQGYDKGLSDMIREDAAKRDEGNAGPATGMGG